jgi:hypothetical protein
VLFVFVKSAYALTPLPDSSPGFFSGEWAGAGFHGAYCYLNLNTDGRGLVLIDNGAGDWLAARIHWRNKQQSVEVEEIIPLRTSTQMRIMPLELFTLKTGFNQSLKLNWNSSSEGCNLLKIVQTANLLNQARNVMNKLKPQKSSQ